MGKLQRQMLALDTSLALSLSTLSLTKGAVCANASNQTPPTFGSKSNNKHYKYR